MIRDLLRKFDSWCWRYGTTNGGYRARMHRITGTMQVRLNGHWNPATRWSFFVPDHGD